jgi:hypothetical protein
LEVTSPGKCAANNEAREARTLMTIKSMSRPCAWAEVNVSADTEEESVGIRAFRTNSRESGEKVGMAYLLTTVPLVEENPHFLV